MSVVLDKVTEVQDSIVDYVGSVKEPLANGVETAVGFVMDRFSDIPAVPFADKLSTPAEVVKAEFDFAGRLLDANKDIVEAVVKAAAPLTNKLLDRSAVKTVKKTAAKAKSAA